MGTVCVARCAAALEYAHRRGVVHRAIKATHIMLTPAGVAVQRPGGAQ